MPKTLRTALLTATNLAFGLAVLSTAGPLQADWLVTRDGARIETKGAWKVDGRRVLFTVPNGTLSMIRTDESLRITTSPGSNDSYSVWAE